MLLELVIGEEIVQGHAIGGYALRFTGEDAYYAFGVGEGDWSRLSRDTPEYATCMEEGQVFSLPSTNNLGRAMYSEGHTKKELQKTDK